MSSLNHRLFYQIASHPHPKTNKHHVRVFVIDNDDNFNDVRDYNIDKSQYNRLLNSKKVNEYKLYSVFALDQINYPTMSDILLLKSSNIANTNQYYDYACV